MNRKQKGVIVLGILLVILSWLYPYYVGEKWNSGVILKSNLGFYFIFNPPSQTEVHQKIFGKLPEHSYELKYCNSRIVTSYLYAQLVVILLACAGLFLLFSDKESKTIRDNNEGISFYNK